jgi:hypothetical protein
MSHDDPGTTCAALGDVTRRAILARFLSGETSNWLVADPLKDAAEWLEEYLPFWEESLDRLDDYLRELQRKEKKDGRGK